MTFYLAECSVLCFAFMDGNTGILYRFFYFAIGFILAVGVYGWIEDIIDETKRREHDQTNKEK